MLLEELSQIRIDGKKLSKEDRKVIINDLFIGKGRIKVSDKDFKEYLNKINYVKIKDMMLQDIRAMMDLPVR